MKAILLESEVFEIKSIKKQTQAKIFKDMIVGDKIDNIQCHSFPSEKECIL